MLSNLARRCHGAASRLLTHALTLPVSVLASGAFANPQALGPSVQDVVEMTRIVQPRRHDADELRTQVSPDGREAFIVVRTANVGADRNRYDILLLDLAAERLAAGKAKPAKTVFSLAATDDSSFGNPALQDARWVDDRTIAFRGRIDDAPVQVHRLDVPTGRVTQLTNEKNRIVSFAVSHDLRRVVYAMQVPNPPLRPGARSVVVANQSFWSVKHGQNDLVAQQRRYQYAVADVGSRRPARLLGDAFSESGGQQPRVDISPDGRWALLHRWEPERQQRWAQRYPMLADTLGRYGPALKIDPLNYFSRPSGYVARRLVSYRLSDGAEQTAVDAPDDSLPGSGQVRPDRIWLDGGRSVVIAGTHLPWKAGKEGPKVSHLVEYWPDRGRWKVIAPLSGRLTAAYPWAGSGGGILVLNGETRRRFVKRADGAWDEVDASKTPDRPARDGRGSAQGWKLRVAEDLNAPPEVVARGPAGETVKLTDLHPGHAPATWGTMRPFGWKDARGRQWDGGLMVPAKYDRARRYPLVIQTYGFNDSNFYLDGANLSNGFTSGFPGRALLREGFLVLAFPVRASSGAPSDDRGAIEAFADGVRGAIDTLVDQGLVDRARVGVMGWSATGELVLNLLTFADAPIRAATLLDGDANTLFSMTITYGFMDSTLARKEQTNGGGPFGVTLDQWISRDPSLHADCVEAALRIETYGPWVLNNWDIYALLRRQYKPVEMIVIPGGAHALSRPSERMLSLQGNVDWYRFWLKGEERSDLVLSGESVAELRAQYARWRPMVEMKRAGEAAPRCPRKAVGGQGKVTRPTS